MNAMTNHQHISRMAMKTNQSGFLSCRASRMGRAVLALFAVIAVSFGLMSTAPAATITNLFEGFEGNFPSDNSWSVSDANATGTNAWWDDVNSTFGTAGVHSGSWKGYCAGYGYAGTSTSPLYQAYMDSYMRRTLDLSGDCSPVLSFWYRTPGIETCCDHMVVSVGGTVVFSNATATAGWSNVVVNLSAWAGTQPTLDFTFHSDLSGQYEGVYLDDILVTSTPATATLYSVWWGPQQDKDGDGCLTATNDTFRLNWDPDVSCSGGTTLSVFEKIYRRTCGASTWSLYYTTSDHTITGTSTGDQQYLDIPASGNCTCYDYKIEIYRSGQSTPDFYRDPTSDALLGGHKEELLSQETATIYSAWWGYQQDLDGDGCLASTNNLFRLYWDADVVGGSGILTVFEKVYYRSCGATNWSIFTTTANHAITNASSTDAVYVDIPAASSCSCYDYRIEVYRAGQTVADFTMDSSNNGALASHREELLAQDFPTVKIYNAWWGNQQDLNTNGCWTAPNDTFRLYVDADATNCAATLQVYEMVYSRPVGSNSWTLYTTTASHWITNCLSTDTVYVDLPAHGGCALYDYKVELYRLNHSAPDFVADSSSFPALGSHKEELQSQEQATFFAAYWAYQQDHDGDGCWASTNNVFRLVWDADVVDCSGSLTVFEKVYYQTCGATGWSLFTTTANHVINGCGIDASYVDIPAATVCSCYNYKIELYRAGQTVPDYILSPTNYPAVLGTHHEELYAQDECLATISDAWWGYQQDHDGDGCWASTNDVFRLTWDPDVVNCSGSITVFEKIYLRTYGTTNWSLWATTAPHAITGISTADQQYVNFPAGAGCNSWDYRIEIYRSGQTVPDYIRDPGNDPDLSNHHEEAYAHDECLATIFDAWWGYQQDHDGDGCWASTNDVFRLTWDPDVVNCSGSIEVFEKIYLRPYGNTNWSLWTTTAPHLITGTNTADQQYVDFPAGTGCNSYDYQIEIYRSGQTVPDYTRNPTNDTDLSNHHEELYAHDECLATIFEAWWGYQQDLDGDGCWASTNNVFRLTWDPDVVNCSGSLSVFEKVYLRNCGTTNWILWRTNAMHTITGTSTADQQYMDIPAGTSCACYDYKIEIYRSGQTVPDYSRDPSNDSDLANHREETLAQDDCSLSTVTIFDAWWSNQADINGNGCWEPLGSNQMFRLNWDPDVVGCSGSLSVFEKVYYQGCGAINWTLFTTTSPHLVTGVSAADQQYIAMPAGTGCSCWNYKIEIYRVGQATPDYIRSVTNDVDLASHTEEWLTHPRLSVVQMSSNVVLSWATNFASFTLESATNLPPGTWTPVGPSPVVVGGQFTVTNTIGVSNKFYHLIR